MGFFEKLKQKQAQKPEQQQAGPEMQKLIAWLESNVKTDEDAALLHKLFKQIEEEDE